MLLLALLGAVGCGGASDERRLILGFLENVDTGAFNALTTGQTVWVREGPQTGKWTMPSVRIWGVKGVVAITSLVTLEDGTKCGGFTANLPIVNKDDALGSYKYDRMPIPIAADPAGPKPTDVYWHTAELKITVDDGSGDDVVYTESVVLGDGDTAGLGP